MNPDFLQFVDSLRDLVLITEASACTDAGPRIVYVNQAFTRATGYAASEAVGRSVCLLRGPGTDAAVISRVRATLARGDTSREVLLHYGKDGSTCWMDLTIKPLRDRDGRITHYAAIERDVSAHKAIERRAQVAADSDALTGLMTRRVFLEHAEHERALSLVEGRGFALLLLDVDHFRSINATHGYHLGDELLVQVATAVRGALRAVDSAGRLAGDEFGIALPGCDPDQAQSAAQHVRAAVRRMRLPGLPWLGVTASIGIACSEAVTDTVPVLLARAENACEQSRRGGRNRVTLDRVYGKVVPFRPRKPVETEPSRFGSPLSME